MCAELKMKIASFCISLLLFAIVVLGAARAIFERRRPFLRKFDDSTRHAYLVLAIAAAMLLAWSVLDLHVETVEIAGVKASVGKLQQRVDTLSNQMEAFFQRKKIEVFGRANWSRVRKIGKAPDHGVILEVTLLQEPIPGSIEVFEGVLLMPEPYHLDARAVQFQANGYNPDLGLTVKYYPKFEQSSQ